MNKTILVTGGAGFIGSSLIGQLLPDHKIICLDNFNDYYNPHWKEENIKPFLAKSNFTLYKTDITDYQALEPIFNNHSIDAIIHLAARAGVRPSIQQPRLYEEVNVKGTLNLLELSHLHKLNQFIFASSSSVYGGQEKIPFSETDPVDHPVSPYAATKKSGELLCYTYSNLYRINTTCLRFFTVYGPKGRPDMAPYLFTKALLTGKPITKYGNGNSRRDYTYIGDIVNGIIKALQNPFPYEIINLGNNNPVGLNEFIATLEEITGGKAVINQLPFQAGDVPQTYANITKAKTLLHWEPKTDLKTGLTKFVEWYKMNRLS